MYSSTFPVPYVSRLEGSGIVPGQSVVIKGVLLEDGFSVNLSGGPRKVDGTAIHINPRPSEKKFVFNAYAEGEWGKEEREKLTLDVDEPFTLRIRCHDSEFEVFANQKHVATFDYRLPLSAVNHLIVDGGIELHSINWGGKYYSVPYQAGFDYGFGPGKKLQISAIPEGKPKRFVVNFLNSLGEVVLHFNPRYDEKAIIRNAKIGDEWGAEEREGKFPLDKKVGFDLEFINEAYAFQIFVNGSLFCAFAHRTDPEDVSGVQIQGDIILQGVHVKDH